MIGFGNKNKTTTDDSSDNNTINDVIGSKNDKSFSNANPSSSDPSVIDHLKAGYYHVHDSASTAGGSRTVDVKVYTHQYPSVTGS